MNIDRIVWTGLRAGFATYTAAVVKINDPVLARIERLGRTDLDTRRVGAMIAAHHAKKPSRVGKIALFDIFYPGPINADRHIVFRFTGDRASVAADTFAVINYETKIHLFYRFLKIVGLRIV